MKFNNELNGLISSQKYNNKKQHQISIIRIDQIRQHSIYYKNIRTMRRRNENFQRLDQHDILEYQRRISTLNLQEKFRNVQNRYQLRANPSVIFRNDQTSVYKFGRSFYLAFLYEMIPCLKQQWQKEKRQADVALKEAYLLLLNSIKSRNKGSVVQLFSFLLCLTVKPDLDKIVGETINVDHLFVKKDNKNQRIQTARTAYIFITFHTLGVMVNASAFSFLYQRFVVRELIKDNLYEIGTVCMSTVFLDFISGKTPQYSQIDKFQEELRSHLQVKQREHRLKTTKKVQIKSLASSPQNSTETIYDEALYHTQTIRPQQLSSSLNSLVSFDEKNSRSPRFKKLFLSSHKYCKSINTTYSNDFISLRACQESRKHDELPRNTFGVKLWQQKVKQMKQNARLSLPYQRLGRKTQCNFMKTKIEREQRNTQIMFTQREKVQSRREKKSQPVTLVFQQKESKIHNSQIGLVTKIVNCPGRQKRQAHQTSGIDKRKLKKQLQKFTANSQNFFKMREEVTINEILIHKMPYMGMRKKGRKNSVL